MKFLVIFLFAMVAFPLLAQVTPPAGPPWNQACQKIEGNRWSQLMLTKDKCAGKDQEFFDRVKSQPATKVVEWLAQNRSCVRLWPLLPWLGFMMPDQNTAKISWLHQIYLTYESAILPYRARKAARHNEYLPAVRELLLKGSTGTVSDDARAHVAAVITKAKSSDPYKDSMAEAYANIDGICLYHKNLACRSAMKEALDLMYPRAFGSQKYPEMAGTFSLLPFYKAAFSDTLTLQYASKLALYLLDFVASGRSQRQKIPELYELGLQAFAGDQDRFWTFMGLLATRGSSFTLMYQIAHEDTKPLYAAYMIISATMSLLDNLWQGTGTAFSYAKGNQNTCYQGKPYHYWMSGTYSYYLHKRGYSEKTAKLVAKLLGAMYELSSRTYGRQPELIFFSEPFAPVAMRTRRELVHHNLGADLGIKGAHPQSFDLHLQATLDSSRPLPKMSKEEMKKKLQNPVIKWQYWTQLTGFYGLP